MPSHERPIRLSFDGDQYLFCNEIIGDAQQHTVYQDGQRIIVERTSEPFNEWATNNITDLILNRRGYAAS